MSLLRPWFAAGVVLVTAASAFADTVTGKVVGPDGKPVAGATIFVSIFSPTSFFPDQKTRTLTSDASGAFTVEVTPPQSSPDIKEKNPTVARAVITAPGFGLAQAFLTLLPGDSNTIRLEKGVALRGKVVDTAGKPVAGAGVHLLSIYLGGPQGAAKNYLWFSDELRNAKSDANGVWTLPDMPATAVHASVALTDPQYVQVSSDIPIGGATEQTIVARPAAVLVGRVVGKEGKPRVGISVSAREEKYGRGDASALTAADGSFRLSGLPTGLMAVWVDKAQPIPGSTEPRPLPGEVSTPLRDVAVTEGKETAAADLVLVPGGVVEGTVVDAGDGKPVPDVFIMAPDSIGVQSANNSSISSSKGTFSLRLPPGKHQLSVLWGPKGYLTTSETGEANTVEVNITEGATVSTAFRLARALTLSGVARDVSGKPVPGVDITVMEQGGPPKATTDVDGKWSLTGIKPGKVRIVAANDFEILSGNEVTLAADPAATPVVLTVKPFNPAAVTGRVRTTSGLPIAGVKIQSLTKMRMGNDSYWFDFQERLSDAQGRFTLPPVRPENPEVELRFNKPGYKTASGGTLTREGDRFVIADALMNALDKGRTLKGQVTNAGGKPVSGAIVAATGVEMGTGETRTDALGRFTLPGVPEESRLLAAQGASFGTVPVTRKTTAVTVRLAPAKKAGSSASEDHARATTIAREIKKRYVAAKRLNLKVDDFAIRELPLTIAPLDFPLALELAKPEGTNPIDDQTLAQMIREVAQKNPARLNDWAAPALKDIGVTAVRASAAYAMVIGLPEGPAKRALASQVYREMQTLTLTGSEHWVVRRVTQMAVLAGMLGLPDESRSWLDKAIAGATEDATKPYIGVVTFESVNGGLPMIRYVLEKTDPKMRAGLSLQLVPRLAQINARAAQKLLAEIQADSALMVKAPKDDWAHARALLEVVRALAPQDPTAALVLAEQLKGSSYASAALALSAQGQPDIQKAALLYERAAGLPDAEDNGEVLVKIAALAWKKDPALGKKLLDQANQAVRSRNSTPEAALQADRTHIAREFTDIRSGESRLMLAIAAGYLMTPEAQKEDSAGTYRQNLALAWLPFSTDQALTIAQRLPEKQESSGYDIRNRTLTKIVVWLLTDPSKRNKLLLSDFDQYGFDAPDS